MSGDKLSGAFQIRPDNRMFALFNDAVEIDDERRKDGQRAQYAERDTLRHNDADICAERQRHRTHREESSNRRQRGRHDRCARFTDGRDHRLLIRLLRFLILIPVQQKNTEVHRDAQLQNGRKRLCDVRNLPEKDIAAEVIDNREDQTEQEDERHHRVLQEQKQHQQAEHDRTQHIFRQLLIDQLLGVLQNGGHAAEETALAHRGFDFRNRIHRAVGRARFIEPHQQHGRVIFAIKEILRVRRQHFLRNRNIQDITRPEHAGNAIDLLQLFLHVQQIRGRHTLYRNHRCGGNLEVILKILLALHRLQIRRQITQNIIIDPCVDVSESGQHEQYTCRREHKAAAFYYKTSHTLHTEYAPFFGSFPADFAGF